MKIYYTTKEVAVHFKVSIGTVRRWVESGCPVLRLGHRTLRFDLDAVSLWLAELGG